MQRFLPALLLLLAVPATASLKWNDVLRDVYVNGALSRDCQTLNCEKPRRMVLLLSSGEVLIFDPVAHEVTTADRALFTFNDDRTAATTPDSFATQRVAAAAMPDETTYLAVVGATSYLIHSHQSHAGPMSEADLWRTAPIWRSIYDHYTPDANVVAQLRDATPARLTIVFATWCGDSKRAVPRLLKALHEANNPNLSVELFGIGPDFLSPLDYIRGHALTNVPTMLVERGSREIGRVVETPVTNSAEQDVATILAGETLPPHRGRYERKTLLASGHYAHRGARGERATEAWELWDTAEGGVLAHSVITETKSGRTTETFAALDGQRLPDFIEVTRRENGHVVRTRASAHDGQWTLHARGDERGLVEQTSVAPASVVLPATLTFGWPLAGDAFVMGENEPIGSVVDARTLHYEVKTSSPLHVPLSVRFPDGSERRLTDMTVVAPASRPAG